MEYIKLYENFDKIPTVELLGGMGVEDYTINSDGSIDVRGKVNAHGGTKDITFNKVDGDFSITGSSLLGSPREITGDFDCTYTILESLKGGPEIVDGDFLISGNKLTSLEYSPKKVGNSFLTGDNKLPSLEGSPLEVGGDFSCSYNQLTSLKGGPEIVNGYFICSDNNIMTFEGSPKSCDVFTCHSNPIDQIWDLFVDFSKIELLNDYDALRVVDGEPCVILDRLNEFLLVIGKEPVKKVYGYKNI